MCSAAGSEIDFSGLADGAGWRGDWRSVGVANLLRAGGEGLLEAGSDVFPDDPRPVAFLRDSRFRDGSITALITRTGAGTGVVLRRVGPRSYYAALYDTERAALIILRRSGTELADLAAVPLAPLTPPLTLTLTATGTAPTALSATIAGEGTPPLSATATDSDSALQRAGDPGVLATARTLLPSGDPVFPALGNLHLLPYGVQEGQAFIETPAGQAFVDEIRRRSTAGFGRISIASAERAGRTLPSVVAAFTGEPLRGGARLQVATDVPADVWIEIARSADFKRVKRVRAGKTGRFEAVSRGVAGLPPGRRVYWRARVRRGDAVVRGPVRSFKVLPLGGGRSQTTIAVGACGSQFGAIFDHLAALRPDVFVWQGDLNYPDTHGPLAQTMSGYGGIWRDFLSNPRLAPILERSVFVGQRDDHDYGLQDSNSTNVVPWGIEPWRALMGRSLYHRFTAGLAEVWVLDQRRFKSDPSLPDTQAKTLLGPQQRRWLLRTLAASRSPFKVICSPCTLFMDGNARDGSWENSFTAERELVLGHIKRRVRGRTIFLTGDTHLTGVFDSDGRYEARAAPIDIPRPNDITLVNPNAAAELRATPGVAYAGDEGHFTLLRARGTAGRATLELTLVREDGATPYRKVFSERVRPAG